MKSQRIILREKLNNTFKNKEIASINDKRRIMKEALGYVATFSSLKEDEFEKVINYLESKSNVELTSNIIAWTYMVEIEEGLTKKQVNTLMQLIPSDISLFPFSLDEWGGLESNSIAIGFLNNEYYDELSDVKKTLGSVCNDWGKENKDNTYTLPSGMKVIMISDFETVINKSTCAKLR